MIFKLKLVPSLAIKLLHPSNSMINTAESEKIVKIMGIIPMRAEEQNRREPADMQQTFRRNRVAALLACARLDDHRLGAAP